MYNLGDNSYLSQPKVMSDQVVDRVLENSASHAQKYELSSFGFGFHGGEPILAGHDFFTKFVEKANAKFAILGITPFYYMQTNGMLMTKKLARLFNELNINVGISLDGTQESNDRYRVDHKGKGTYTRIIAGIQNMEENRDPVSGKINLGILNVIDIDSDPNELYEHYKERLNTLSFDLLLPLANFDKLPPKPVAGPFANSETPYADWLLALFIAWFHDSSKNKPFIRIFDTIIRQILGGKASMDSLGNNDKGLLVIETDGGIEPVDVLKMCGDGFTKQNLNILSDSFEDAFKKPLVATYIQNEKHLCEKCKICPILEMCGGGYLPHRYSSLNNFDNPSVYCRDLIKLIAGIQSLVIRELPEELKTRFSLRELSYEKITNQLYGN